MNKHLLTIFSFLCFFYACETSVSEQKEPVKSTTLKIKSVTVNRTQGDCQSNASDAKCAKINIQHPVVSGGPARLAKNVSNWTNDFLISWLDPQLELDEETSLSSAMEGFFIMHDEVSRELPEVANQFSVEVTDTILFQNEIYLTLRMDAYSYAGGAHPNTSSALASFDLKTGQLIRPIDLVNDLEKLYGIAEQKFREIQKEAFEAGFDFDKNWPFELAQNVGLTTEGLFFVYVPYEVAPYTMGFTEFVIPYNELKKL